MSGSQLELVTRPDGQTVDFVYGASTGRLDSVVAPNGIYGYSYDPTSGNLASITEPGGGLLAFGYDGSLPTSVTWSGAVAGSVEVGYEEPASGPARGGLVEESNRAVQEHRARSRGSIRLGEATLYTSRCNLPILARALFGATRSKRVQYEPFGS